LCDLCDHSAGLCHSPPSELGSAVLGPYDIIPYQRKHRQAVFDLIFESANAHLHLDWYRSDEWLDMRDNITLLAFDADVLVGALGVSAPAGGTCWVRVLVIDDTMEHANVLPALWERVRAELAQAQVQTAAALLLEGWVSPHLYTMGMSHSEDIVTLSRSGHLPPKPLKRRSMVTIRMATVDDLPKMIAIDHAAFQPLWRMTGDEIRRAKKLAAVCTLALTAKNQVVGYQLSTLYNRSGHLARLAVSPQAQNMGVGAALMDDLLWRFIRREVQTITVNTQASNDRSQRLYQRHEFRLNGHSLQVWMARL